MSTPHCSRPPAGWWCSRTADHDGPCAARPFEAHVAGDGPFSAKDGALLRGLLSTAFERMSETLLDPEAAVAALPQDERDEHERAKRSVIAARRSAQAVEGQEIVGLTSKEKPNG